MINLGICLSGSSERFSHISLSSSNDSVLFSLFQINNQTAMIKRC